MTTVIKPSGIKNYKINSIAKNENIFSLLKPIKIYFSCQLSDSKFFLTLKVNLFKSFMWKILFNSIRNFKET